MEVYVGARIPDVAKIAVLRANALGDFLFSLPALEALRAAYPEAEIVLLGAPWHERFLTGRPGPVDRVMVVPALPGIRAAEPGDPEPGDAAGFTAKARTENFDLALQLHGGGKNSNPLVAAIGARVTAGLRADDAPPLDRWIRYIYFQPEVFRYLEVVGLVGAAPVNFQPRFTPTAADVAEARGVLGPPESLRVGLHPGATDPRRRWPADRFAALGDAVAAAGAEVVITGTDAEASIVDSVRSTMRAPARALVGALSIGGLAAAYADCALVVSNDTGPIHLAAAVGTPTVGVFWIGNLINGAAVTREWHRAIPSWTMYCPECGADSARDIYPARASGATCRHSASFVAEVPAVEVIEQALDLLQRSTRPLDRGPRSALSPLAAGEKAQR
jgi:ADP-heptose:LPS heptosyltransferase